MSALSKPSRLIVLVALIGLFSSHERQVWQGPIPLRPVPRQYFGMHIHYALDRTSWPSAQIGAWRLWDTNVSWAELEPARGEWHFEKLDRLVQLAAEHHTELILTLAYTPQWASLR